MLAKFSVKKPFTVLVGVLLIIILGVVAFTRMTPDLLPSIDLPYVVVVTTYIGASPEEVEQVITKPVEQSMATLDHIKSVSSNSSENYSLVIMEFADEADMDAVAMNIREKLDLLGGSWNDYVGIPTILKLNPNMLPLAVTAVSREGYDAIEMSAFYENTLLPKLEGIEGVASISASGLIAETVRVELDEKKLEAVNERIRAAIDKEFAEGEAELSDAKAEIADGFEQISEGEEAIEKGRSQLSSARRKLEKELSGAEAQLSAGAKQLAQAKLDTINGIEQLNAGIAEVDQGLSTLRKLKADQVAAQTAVSTLTPTITVLRAMERDINDEDGSSEETLLALEVMGMTPEDVPGALSEAEQSRQKAEEGLATIDAALAEEGISDLDAAIAAATATRTELVVQRDALNLVLNQLNSSEADIDAAYTELAKQEKAAKSQISSASRKLTTSEKTLEESRTQLTDAEKELADAEKQLAETKENAYQGANLDNILSLSTIGAILGAENFSMPAGYAASGKDEWLIYVGDKLQNADELSELILLDLGIGDLEPILLSEVANIYVTDNSGETYARINGSDGVLLSFSKQSGYATATVSKNMEKEFAVLCEAYPGLSFSKLMDQGDYIELVINSVLENIGLGAVLAVVILLLFLFDLRPTFVVACSIPISVTFAIVLMYFSGVTLNVISMSGLAVGVGMLVDNSIVVIENIYRLRRLGVSANKAAISGATQVAGAITASTLTTVCVFVPIIFVQGLTRQIFADMALTIGYSLMASLIIALTLVPALSAGILRRTKERPQRLTLWLQDIYKATLRFALRCRWLCIVLSLVLLAGTLSAALARGFSYMPDMDSTQVTVTLTLDEDAVIADTAKVGDEAASRVMLLPDVESVGVMLEGGIGATVGLSMSAQSENVATIYIVLSEEKTHSSMEIAHMIEESLADLPCEVAAAGGSLEGYASALTGNGISVSIYGEDLDLLQQTAKEVAAILSTVDGVDDVSDGLEATAPALRITVDKAAAMREGLTVAQVYQEIATYLTVDASVTSFDATDQDVVVAMLSRMPTVRDLKRHVLTIQKQDGTYKDVRLSEIAEFSESETLQTIARSAQRRQIAVTAALEEGRNITLVTEEAKKAMQDYTPPEGFTYEFDGENEMIVGALEDLMIMLIIGVAIVYLIMVAQFQSLLSPLIVMVTVPLAFTGGLAGLLFAGMDISIVSMIGFIMLVGIIVNNGIVLIDTMNQLRAEGMPRRAAVIEAASMRIRPVLMTALTTVLGLIPLGLGIGIGATLVQPVAVVSIGGLVYATFMTLYIVPILYDLIVRRPPRKVSAEDMELTQQ